jgi:hypothetical protein
LALLFEIFWRAALLEILRPGALPRHRSLDSNIPDQAIEVAARSWRCCGRNLIMPVLWICKILWLLRLSPHAGRGGVARSSEPATLCREGEGGGIIELIYVGGTLASTTFCRQGGVSATSGEEALLQSRGGCSKLPSGEMMRSPQLGGGPRRKIIAGRGLPSSWSLLLGGDAWRTPARCGGGARGLHCKKIICSMVFFVKRGALSVDRRFPWAGMLRFFLNIVPATN